MLSLSLLVPDNTLPIVRKAMIWKITVIYVNLIVEVFKSTSTSAMRAVNSCSTTLTTVSLTSAGLFI